MQKVPQMGLYWETHPLVTISTIDKPQRQYWPVHAIAAHMWLIYAEWLQPLWSWVILWLTGFFSRRKVARAVSKSAFIIEMIGWYFNPTYWNDMTVFGSFAIIELQSTVKGMVPNASFRSICLKIFLSLRSRYIGVSAENTPLHPHLTEVETRFGN